MSTIKDLTFSGKATVCCTGKNPPFDHPKVFLHLEEEKKSIVCPYCSRKFIYTEKESDQQRKES